MKQINALMELISTLQKDLEQERIYESLRKEIEQERRHSSQLEILLNPSHQLQVITIILIRIVYIIYISNLQAKKQEKVKAEEEEKPDIPGMVSNKMNQLAMHDTTEIIKILQDQ